jgi:hypothetical protein
MRRLSLLLTPLSLVFLSCLREPSSSTVEPDADLRHDLLPADPICDGGAKKTGDIVLVAESFGPRRIRTTIKNKGCGPACCGRWGDRLTVLVGVFDIDAATPSLHCSIGGYSNNPMASGHTEIAPGETKTWISELTNGNCDAKEVRLAAFCSTVACALHTGDLNQKIYSNSVTLPPSP